LSTESPSFQFLLSAGVFAIVVRLNAPPNFSAYVAGYRRLSKGEMSREAWSRSFWGTMPIFRKLQN
jgi:hypothetical protein